MRATVRIVACIASLCTSLLVMDADGVAAEDESCRAAQIALDGKRVLLGQYMDALGKASTEKDQQLMTALSHSVGAIIKDIGKLEEETAGCPPLARRVDPAGLGPIRSDPGNRVKASCSELTKRHLQLSRKINSMARRQQSLFAEPTDEEKTAFSDAETELKEVEAVIQAQCGQTRPSTAARQKQRRTHPPQ